MNIEDFEIGKTYRMTIVPYLDYEPGEESFRTLKVLEPATAENSRVDDGATVEIPPPSVLEAWAKFLRVRDESGRVRLQIPSLVVAAEEIIPCV